MVTLVVGELACFSQGDEEAFFDWLNGIGCVADSRHVGKQLLITVEESDLPDTDLRELIALFHRYGVDKKQLAQFVTPTNAAWFRDDDTNYWHAEVFAA
jgi:hypothetical protein